MGPELDLSRLEELHDLLQADLSELVTQLTARLCDALNRIDCAFAVDDLRAVADAAHAARNEALMVGARRLLKALDAVEFNARDRHSQAAREAMAGVHVIWPDVRAALQSVAAE
jgi:ATP-dependent protease HslVU (ClpYQ) ATPase subunit